MVFGKRIDRPGGSRRATRQDMLIPTAMMTMTDSRSVDLLDLSKSGARIRGTHLPSPGQEVILLIARLEAFATVIWRDEDECGVHFDIALSDRALATVESERGQSTPSGSSSDAILASADWENGLAR
jgi:hypothetical protein